MNQEALDLADRILKAFENWSRDTNQQNRAASVEGRYSAESHECGEVAVLDMMLCEEAITACMRTMSALSLDMRQCILAQYRGLQGYYKPKINPRQLYRAKRMSFDNVLWQNDLDRAVIAFLNRLKQQSGSKFTVWYK